MNENRDDDPVRGAGYATGASLADMAVRWSRLGRFVDLVVLAVTLVWFARTGSGLALVSAIVAAGLWLVDLAVYRRLTRPAPPARQ